MGKTTGFLILLIFVDLFFIATGQICSGGTCSIGSLIFNSILNIGNIPLGQLFTDFIGDFANLFSSGTGIAALITAGGVTIGAFLVTKEFRLLLIPITFTLALIGSDFVVIAVYLLSLNKLLATFIMAPIIIIYIFTIVEWLVGKD